jgi:hypothetical protein
VNPETSAFLPADLPSEAFYGNRGEGLVNDVERIRYLRIVNKYARRRSDRESPSKVRTRP